MTLDRECYTLLVDDSLLDEIFGDSERQRKVTQDGGHDPMSTHSCGTYFAPVIGIFDFPERKMRLDSLTVSGTDVATLQPDMDPMQASYE